MRKRVAGLLAGFCVLLAACSDKTSVPWGILPLDKMTPVMWDMVEADQYAAMLVKDSAHVEPKLVRMQLYDQVLRSHAVSREKFEKSYNYYREHPEINQILYDSLAAQGNRYRNEAYAHPGPRPAVTTPVPAPTTPAGTPPGGPHGVPPAGNPMLHTPGRPGIPILRPFIKPDTTHRRNKLQTTPATQKTSPGHPSSSLPTRQPMR